MIDNSLPLFLASKSPRRRKLLKLIYPHVRVLDVHTEEAFRKNETASQTVKRIAEEKMDAAVKQIKHGLVLTADTIVVIDGRILGKPRDAADAEKMLRRLSGRAHLVFTGVCLHLLPQNIRLTAYEKTKVVFRKLGKEEIKMYVSSGSPLDKAGSYGIQDDYGAVFVEKIVGCYYNVVGLPVSKVHTLITKVIAGASKD